METRKIIRTKDAGVFFGEIEELNTQEKYAVIRNARRIWYWDGASSLSELAQYGTVNPNECKFPCAVDKVQLFEVIEILNVTEEAAVSIDGVPEWKKR